MSAAGLREDMILRIRQAVLDELFVHAREEAPNECCGLLIGTEGFIHRAARARNLRQGPTRYLIDPVDHFAAVRTARTDGLSVVGAYHSHPASGPGPSKTDLAEAASPTFAYVIVSPGTRDTADAVQAFYLAPENVIPLELVPVA